MAWKLSEDFNYDCVTLDGDIYYGQGLVTGGAPPKIQQLIQKATFIKEISSTINDIEWKINEEV